MRVRETGGEDLLLARYWIDTLAVAGGRWGTVALNSAAPASWRIMEIGGRVGAFAVDGADDEVWLRIAGRIRVLEVDSATDEVWLRTGGRLEVRGSNSGGGEVTLRVGELCHEFGADEVGCIDDKIGLRMSGIEVLLS